MPDHPYRGKADDIGRKLGQSHRDRLINRLLEVDPLILYRVIPEDLATIVLVATDLAVQDLVTILRGVGMPEDLAESIRGILGDMMGDPQGNDDTAVSPDQNG